MKVLNLCCANAHPFEGWFASHDDFLEQGERHLIACPICGDTRIERRPNAPRLNVATPRGDAIPPPPPAATSVTELATPASTALVHAQGRMLRAVQELISRTEDVGDRFPEEARRIHYGEAEERSIRGQATADDAEALRDEGIEVISLPVPAALKGPLQ